MFPIKAEHTITEANVDKRCVIITNKKDEIV
jgi:hypothetical protein